MKKKLVTLVCVCMIVLGVVGCSFGQSEQTGLVKPDFSVQANFSPDIHFNDIEFKVISEKKDSDWDTYLLWDAYAIVDKEEFDRLYKETDDDFTDYDKVENTDIGKEYIDYEGDVDTFRKDYDMHYGQDTTPYPGSYYIIFDKKTNTIFLRIKNEPYAGDMTIKKSE